MAAIAEELVFREKPRVKVDDDGPEVSVALGPAGRETLALIAEDARAPARSRDRLSTLDYGDRISNAPGSKTPSRAPAAQVANESRPSPLSAVPTIFEMLSFVVQGADAATLASEAQRRRFVETYLLQRLPAQDMARVDRVDVTPWTVRDTLVVRVWCRV